VPEAATDRHVELYVYYRLDPADAAAAQREIEQAQAALRRARPGLRTRLLQRPPQPGTALTWMEIYHHPAGLDAADLAALQDALQALPSQRQGPRHAELFEALDN
jgi:hypothetical protein